MWTHLGRGERRETEKYSLWLVVGMPARQVSTGQGLRPKCLAVELLTPANEGLPDVRRLDGCTAGMYGVAQHGWRVEGNWVCAAAHTGGKEKEKSQTRERRSEFSGTERERRERENEREREL